MIERGKIAGAEIERPKGFKEWEWLRDFIPGGDDDNEKITELQPIEKFLSDMVAGRPISCCCYH